VELLVVLVLLVGMPLAEMHWGHARRSSAPGRSPGRARSPRPRPGAIDAEHRLGVGVRPSVSARTREIGTTGGLAVDASPDGVTTASSIADNPPYDPSHVAFLGAMRAVFAATWCETMGRRWPDLRGDVDALCERTLAIGHALRRGRPPEQVAVDLGGRHPEEVERGPHEGALDDPPPRGVGRSIGGQGRLARPRTRFS
jgi:hypothetical protein